jgi:type II secretory pathway pseudopilin PulG
MIRRSQEDGFALMDALVALGILGVILAMFVQTVHSTVTARRHAADSSRAILVAQSRLALAVESDGLPPSGRDGDLAWSSTIVRYPGTLDSQGLEKVTVSVAERLSGRALVTLSTLRLARVNDPR